MSEYKMIRIDKLLYPTNNYYKSKHDKTQIIIGGSLRKKNFHIKRYEISENGNAKAYPTYSISRDGNIYEHFNPEYYSDFMKNKDIDKKSISILLENMGMLFYDYESESYLNWVHDKCEEDMVYEKKWNGHTYWEKYTEEQYLSLVDLCKYLIDKFNIELDCLGFNVFYKDTIKYEGIVCRSNYSSDYTDLNPNFNFGRFLKDLDIEIDE